MERYPSPVTQHLYKDGEVSSERVLELLNDAVWAPNDGLREPWRFIYADREQGRLNRGLQNPAFAYLLVVMKEDADPHKRKEDFAAVCCLVQNFVLLAAEKGLGVKWTMHEWFYDAELNRGFGVGEKERLAAVLELGYADPELGKAFVTGDPPALRVDRI
ncbi:MULTISPECIES: nitroreductase family protein [Paenibacillus]|uniref:nitroreductase family protein n=1 Tax=Paenibacillus TaxID=44249 RepID=UPI002FE0C33B